jgi:glycosyltransferase involved in cell wall biosynthesis
MNVLITNIELGLRSGTVVYVFELAVGLKEKGYHVEVYTRVVGDTARELIKKGIHVTDDLSELKNIPDIIHAHHNLVTIEVLHRFKKTPVILFLHDRISIYEIPVKNVRILKYIAVDYNCLDRLRIDAEIPEKYTGVIYNWVNTNRFKLRKEFASRPSTALVFSNYAKENNHYQVIASACKQYGLTLEVIGSGTGNYIKQPEEMLLKYDLVFAKAKAAMEALSTEAAVVLCDFHGLGEMVAPVNLNYLRDFNFGMKTLTRPFNVTLLMEEISKFNESNNRLNAEWIREQASFSHVLEQIMQLYHQTVTDYRQGIRGMPINTVSSWWSEVRVKIRVSLPVRGVYKMIRILKKLFVTAFY